jgi:hypothetical protein
MKLSTGVDEKDSSSRSGIIAKKTIKNTLDSEFI